MTTFQLFCTPLLLLLVACGQDFPQNNSPTPSSLTYHGNTLPVKISTENAVSIARFVLGDNRSLSTIAAGAINQPLTNHQHHYTPQHIPVQLQSLLQKHQQNPTSYAPATGGVQSVSTTQHGQDGGSVYIISEQNSSTQTTHTIMVYQQFSEQGQTLDGKVTITTNAREHTNCHQLSISAFIHHAIAHHRCA